MSKKLNESSKETKPVKGIKHHGTLSFIGLILIVVVAILLLTHPGEVIFGLLSLLGKILSMDFGTLCILAIVAGFAVLALSLL